MNKGEIKVHLVHCNQGEYLNSCKYGESDICPALKKKKRNGMKKYLYTQVDKKTGKIWIESDDGVPNLYSTYREAKDDLFLGNKIGKVKIILVRK